MAAGAPSQRLARGPERTATDADNPLPTAHHRPVPLPEDAKAVDLNGLARTWTTTSTPRGPAGTGAKARRHFRGINAVNRVPISALDPHFAPHVPEKGSESGPRGAARRPCRACRSSFRHRRPPQCRASSNPQRVKGTFHPVGGVKVPFTREGCGLDPPSPQADQLRSLGAAAMRTVGRAGGCSPCVAPMRRRCAVDR